MDDVEPLVLLEQSLGWLVLGKVTVWRFPLRLIVAAYKGYVRPAILYGGET